MAWSCRFRVWGEQIDSARSADSSNQKRMLHPPDTCKQTLWDAEPTKAPKKGEDIEALGRALSSTMLLEAKEEATAGPDPPHPKACTLGQWWHGLAEGFASNRNSSWLELQ